MKFQALMLKLQEKRNSFTFRQIRNTMLISALMMLGSLVLWKHHLLQLMPH